ncbi:hypothetical protein M9H77_31617 [Catharanthus roseus]|uniref:Uncharacterized protein n=1 Tax=Catharanthus roseus TaxID=4058 RepID=A0ACC0A0J3_CATRO|nr:hypothetical protein M9H77_31617 [Catharanthus roseus]
MTIDQYLVKRILVHTEGSVNVLFKDIFKQMGIPWDKVVPYAPPLVDFTGRIRSSLGGLRIAKTLKLTHILVRSDSQVVIGQVTGIFEAEEENMKQYLACVQHLISEFTCVNFEKSGPNRKLDSTWEGPYQVIKGNGNRSYKLQDFEGKILNNLNLRKFFP